ncbi:phage GP46 family protein [Microbaculum marinisediminis]|uniref:Phage GP46 family protein n=1 Tax=Microbaculum marinisediminis TaxID=2931392 RepID=A0AAW5QRT3_9HYPH|nr:phage GP46 family protein [Microbaculum sp. A6E488]MCT8970577.1 phage GP46 family protein [Microbaculum sp. A6E488]
MTDIIVRSTEGCDPQPDLLWDSLWNPDLGVADWAIAGDDEALNRGGLRATAALHTAVILCLFTDRRLPDDMEHPDAVGDSWPGGAAFVDRRGWHGDTYDVRDDLGEGEMGSLLWTLERGTLDDASARRAEAFASEALQTLVEQGAVARIEAVATALPIAGRLELIIHLFSHDGAKVYDQRFADIWTQTIR